MYKRIFFCLQTHILISSGVLDLQESESEAQNSRARTTDETTCFRELIGVFPVVINGFIMLCSHAINRNN